MNRRLFIKKSAAFGALTLTMLTGLLKSTAALAATWNSVAFSAKTNDEAIKDAGYDGAIDSTDIILKVPEIAENGAVVQVEATSNIAGTTAIAFFIAENPNPLIAEFTFLNGALPFISTRVKMAKTSTVRVSVKANGKVYTTTKSVKVTAGGCGG